MTDDLISLRPAGHCAGDGCASILLAKDVWSRFPKARRQDLAVAFARHAARGLCSRCYERARGSGTLIDHETKHMPRELRASDYEMIRDDLPSASMYARLRAAGERLKCHPDSVKDAVRSQGREP